MRKGIRREGASNPQLILTTQIKNGTIGTQKRNKEMIDQNCFIFIEDLFCVSRLNCRLKMINMQTVLLLLFTVGAYKVGGQSVTTIPLNRAITLVDKNLFNQIVNINASSTIGFDVINVDKNISFIIFQVHSFNYNVTLYTNMYTQGSYVTGRNIGLYSTAPWKDIMYIQNSNDVNLTLLISVNGYSEKDPIPGGCNNEFLVPNPLVWATYMKDYISVGATGARYYLDNDCTNLSGVGVNFYLMYLPEKEVDANTYFDGIKKMMTLENIRVNGRQIPQTAAAWYMQRMVSAYTGLGAIFVVVAHNTKSPEYNSVYVPTYTYACTLAEDGDCEILDDFLSKFLCALLLFVGVFICYFGHRFFKTEMFLFGMLTGIVITYIVISIMVDIDKAALLSASVLSGIFFGAIWLTFWWFYGIPVAAVTLPALNLGFLMSSIIYIEFPGDVLLVQDDFNFWTLFILVMVLTSMILVTVAFASNILCCAVLGAYATVYPIDFYLGSNLKYFIINIVRRATVPQFNKADLMMPFEWRDIVVILIWAFLAISGFVFQHYRQRGRPPFPPPPRSVRPASPEPQGYAPIPGTSRVGRRSPPPQSVRPAISEPQGYASIPSASRPEVSVPPPTAPVAKGDIANEHTRLLAWVDSTYSTIP